MAAPAGSRLPTSTPSSPAYRIAGSAPDVARRGHGEGSIYRTPDGSRHGSINLGTGADGGRLRRHVRDRTQSQVRQKLDRLKRDRQAGADLTVTHERPLASRQRRGSTSSSGHAGRRRPRPTGPTSSTWSPFAGFAWTGSAPSTSRASTSAWPPAACCRSRSRGYTGPTGLALGRRSSEAAWPATR